MELINNYNQISETISAKFPSIKNEISLYLLASIAREFRIGFDFFDIFDIRILNGVEKIYLREIDFEYSGKSPKDFKDFDEYLNEYRAKEKFYYRKLCKFLIKTYLNENIKNLDNSLFTSKTLLNQLIDVAQPKPNQKIYDANCGIGSLFVELYNRFSDFNLEFIGQTNYKMGFICELNLFANNIEKYRINSFNPLKENYENHENYVYQNYIRNKADLAITVPPFGLRNQGGFKLANSINSRKKTSRIEIAYIELMLSATKPDGKVVALLPEGFLNSSHPEFLFFRKRYVENDWVEKIISLPSGTLYPYTSVKTSIVLLNKNKLDKGIITFDGEDEGFEETKIEVSQIKATEDFDLGSKRYALKESKMLRNIFAHPGYPVKKIKDLATVMIGATLSPNQQNGKTTTKSLPYVRIKDLANNEPNAILDISKVERSISKENAYKVIDFDALLVSTIGYELKPTKFKYVGEPIVIGSDVIALQVNEEKIGIEYFLSQLHSKLVQTQIKMISSGTVIDRISKKDFESIQIILPSLEEQQRQIFEMRGAIEEKAIAQEKVEDALEDAQRTDYELIASVAHSFKNKLSPIVMDYAILVDFLKDANENNSPVKLDTLVRPVFENETIDDVDTYEKIANRINTQLKDLPKIFNDFQILQKQTVKKEIVNLNDYFSKVKLKYSRQNYNLEVVKKNRSLFVELDEDAFESVIENLINNAAEHAFKDEAKEYNIVFELSKFEDLEGIKYARILYKDNGRGFPKNYSVVNYKTFGNKSVYSEGSGIGGFIVSKMIELHNGKVQILPVSEFDSYKAQIEILLPLED